MKRVYLAGVLLPKLAKHLALLAGLMIVGHAAGRPALGQLSIFITVVVAALLHSAGCALRRRLPPSVPLSGGAHDRGAA